MIKYLKLFETTSDYEAYINGEGVVLPNVSVAKDAPKIVYYNPIPPFFAKLSLDNGEVVELQGRGELTEAMVSPHQSSLVSAEIGELCTSIGSFAFRDCEGLTSVTIPDGVTSIGRFAFSGCKGLTSITIPDSVTIIDGFAFGWCSGLTNVTIGNGVTSIGERVFEGCTGLTNIVVDSANTVYDSRDNCNAIINTSTNELVVGCKSTVIPNTVTSIGEQSFYNCSSLTSIIIPNSVTSIDRKAFYQCTGLTSVTIPNSVTSIGNQAFISCSGLTSVTIGNSVTSIGSSAFNSCSGLTSVTIPGSVTSIGDYAFSSCSGLTSIVVDSANTVYDSRDNCNAIINTSTNELIKGCKNTVIPNTVTSIGNSAFYGCTNLTSVSIPNSVTTIGNNAFGYCTGLTSITIPDSVTSIGNGAFDYCSSLTSVTIGSNVISIGEWAFGNCSSLTSITSLATTAPTIDSYTFQNIKTGGTLTVPSGSTGYDTWMGTGNYYLGKYGWVIPFFAKLSLDNGEVVELQGSGALTEEMVSQYQSSLVSAEIGELCTSIGEWAFIDCRSLTSVTIGSGVTSIGDMVFGGCENLTTITSLATTAPTIEWGTFQEVKTGGTLRVPSGSTGYDEWMSYLDMYNWTKDELNRQ